MNANTPLRLNKPKSNIGFPMKANVKNSLHRLDDPALSLFTDFYLTPAISVLAVMQIDNALTKMIVSGLRLLFVVDSSFCILGSITSYDIQGEKPLRYLQSRDCRIGICSRDDILVQDIMTPLQKWKVIKYDQLANATIANVVQTFKDLGQRHLIVVDSANRRNGQILRGLISQTSLERAVGTNINSINVPDSFAELTHELAT